ncbi:MAG TPA: class I SAM-dependent methyltransferase [Bryobacteraceae bacterium]|nr:class I SAM-dependent methyltransferase [Bryobacteraceae bacterium]
MAAENDASLQELEQAVREIQDRVRARHPQGERGSFGVPMANLLPLLHSRDAAEAKVAAIGTVNPRPPGFKNNLIQKWKRFVARVLDWHVREQVEFNRAQMNCVQATLEALNDHNRALETIAAALGDCQAAIHKLQSAADSANGRLDSLEPLRHRTTELADITKHWHEWRKEWERKLAINEMQFLRSVADLQSGFTHRSSTMEGTFREIAKAQHTAFEGALTNANAELQRRLWSDLDRIRTEYESIIHSELRTVRQKAFAAAAVAQPAPGKPDEAHSYDFLRFAERYRGPEQYVRQNLENYLGYFEGKTRIVDLGCGRGEMLELLREKGIPALGVDGDEESVAICKSKGLRAEVGDLFTWLQSQADGAFEVLFCSQVIEHLPPLQLPEFVRLCAAKLERGGVLIYETPNPECLAIFATHFYLDPTHHRPVPPVLAAFHMEEAGLGRIEVKRLAPAIDSMPSLASLPADFREAFFGCLDYAIIGRKL